MSAAGENQELMALKKLLTSWHVGVLFDLFKEEDIAINELKMINYSHIPSLLKGYKMGVKIRFEYNLRHWRQKIGLPLETCEVNHHSFCCITKRNFENNISENHNSEYTTINDAKKRRSDIDSGAMKREYMDENHAPSSPQSVYSNNSLINMLNTDDVFNLARMPESANVRTHNIDHEIDCDNVPLQALAEVLSDADNVAPKFPSKTNHEKCTTDLKQILQRSGSRATKILKFFQEKNCLTYDHRSQLIQLIVDYFIENDYHLSLNLSHNLEWEIIKMFPTEKLEYYRTEKRGKIYAKFSNMKRYKRERRLRSMTEAQAINSNTRRSRQNADVGEMNSFVQEGDDNWYPTTEPEVVVKEEDMDENT